MSVWAELKRRSVFKVGVAYLALAWLLAQVTGFLVPAFALPDWVTRFVVLILVVGFPLALFLAWAYEVTPDGIKRTQQVPLGESVREVTGQKLNYVVTGLLVLAVGWIVLDDYVLQRPENAAMRSDAATDAAGTPARRGAADAAAGEEPGEDRLPNSVAVLPFDNLSTDPEHAYFAVGIHEEILNQLAKVRSLNVISRTSVLRYATDRPSIPEIAQALNVGAVMEGSVRYAGNRIQVTVQLIDPTTDSHLWSESYPGDVSDLGTIFALQADIATNVADRLRAELTPAELASIERPPTESAEAYEYYLAAVDATRGAATAETLTRALALVESTLALDANFASAWALKSGIHSSLVLQGPLARIGEQQEAAEQAAQRAVAIAPELGDVQAQLAFSLIQRGELVESERAYRRAEQLGFANTAFFGHGPFLIAAGDLARAREVLETSRDVDPLNETSRAFLIAAYGLAGDIDTAAEEHARGRALFDSWLLGDEHMMRLRLGAGDTTAAAGLMPADPITAAARVDLDAPRQALAALRQLREDPASGNPPALTRIALWAAYFGDPELALDIMEELVAANRQRAYVFWYPQMSVVRQLPGFKTIMREAGFVDYWNEFGWPEACRRTTGDDFECA